MGDILERIFSGGNDLGGLDSETRNVRFFDRDVAQEDFEAIRKTVGAGLFDEMSLGDKYDTSLRQFIFENRSSLEEHPNVLTALLHQMAPKKSGTEERTIPLTVDDDDSGVVVADPARTIPAQDVFEYAQRQGTSPRKLRKYLEENFGMENKGLVGDPDQITAFSVFLNFAAGLKRGDLDEAGQDQDTPGLPDATSNSSLDYLTDNFVKDAGRGTGRLKPPDRDAPGLFLPSSTALDEIKNVLKLYRDLQNARDNGEDLNDVTDFQGRTLADYLEEAGRQPPNDISLFSDDALKALIMSMVNTAVRREIEQNNDYLYDKASIVFAEDAPARDGDRAVDDDTSLVIGNSDATTAQETYYHLMTQQALKESERTAHEMKEWPIHLRGGFEDADDPDADEGKVVKSYDWPRFWWEAVEGGWLTIQPPLRPEGKQE